MSRDKPILGLALSGGQLKAAAHIGVLEELERLGIQPDVIAGTSAGSLVGALYAHGYRTKQFHQILKSFPGLKLLDFGFPVWSSIGSLAKSWLPKWTSSKIPTVPTGLLRGRKLKRYIERLLSSRRLQIPLYIVATDLVTGTPVVLSSENVEERADDAFVKLDDIPSAVTASCALPGIFTPVVMGKWVLIDGAMRHYVPVSVLETVGCDKIIAVNLYRLPEEYEPRTLVDVLTRSFDILLRESIDNDVKPDGHVYTLEPDLSHVHWRHFSQMTDCVEIGKQLVQTQEQALRNFLNS